MEFVCNLDELGELGLTFTEYLILFSLYNNVKYRNIEINPKVYELLESKDYIIKSDNEDFGYSLTNKGINFFNPNTDLFDRFIETFPTRVTDPISGLTRVLSPATGDTIAGKKLRKKWDSVTKGRVDFQNHIINCLNAEINHRRAYGNLQWMRNIETWFNNGTWEDYEYLLTNSESNRSQDNTIRL